MTRETWTYKKNRPPLRNQAGNSRWKAAPVQRQIPAAIALAGKIALLAVVLLVTFQQDGYAYTDPGSGALLWQIILVSFSAALFHVRRVWHWIVRRREAPEDASDQGKEE